MVLRMTWIRLLSALVAGGLALGAWATYGQAEPDAGNVLATAPRVAPAAARSYPSYLSSSCHVAVRLDVTRASQPARLRAVYQGVARALARDGSMAELTALADRIDCLELCISEPSPELPEQSVVGLAIQGDLPADLAAKIARSRASNQASRQLVTAPRPGLVLVASAPQLLQEMSNVAPAASPPPWPLWLSLRASAAQKWQRSLGSTSAPDLSQLESLEVSGDAALANLTLRLGVSERAAAERLLATVQLAVPDEQKKNGRAPLAGLRLELENNTVVGSLPLPKDLLERALSRALEVVSSLGGASPSHGKAPPAPH